MKNKKINLLFLSFLFLFNLEVNALNKAPIDITNKSIKELNYYLSAGIITSEELINLYLDRINEYDEMYNSIITINESAINEAKKLDEERHEKKERSILHGIPIIVKDNIDVFGLPTTAGAKALSDNYPKENSEVVQALIDAGAIILAKANMSEFAFSADTSNSSYGNIRNAYNTSYTPYGSSGGPAVAVAAAFSPVALGTDTSSSVRLPAAANNLIGLRPTTKTLSGKGVLPYDIERDTVGILTTNVDDLKIVYDILTKNKKEKVKLTTLEGITIGIPTDFFKGDNSNSLTKNQKTYPEITKLMEKAIKNLEQKGAKIVYLDTYYTSDTDYYSNTSLSGYLLCDEFNKYIKNTTGTIRSFEDLNLSNQKIYELESSAYYCGTTRTLDYKNELKAKYRKYINEIMSENNLDVIAYPSSKNKLAKYNDYSTLNNLTAHAAPAINYPAITVRLGFDKDDLPYGIEFMGKSNEEELLLNISSIYEEDYINFKTPKITPPLYEVDEEVTTLVNNYEEIYSKKKKFKSEEKWLNETNDFFRTYSKNENVVKDAEVLNASFKNDLNKPIKTLKIIIVIIIIIMILFLIRIINQFKKIIKRKFGK